MDRIDIHEDLCAELHKLYVAKNADYGDSFAKVREEIPNAILVRLSDKLNRLKSLMTKDDDERKVLDESIDDTLMDIANYALLEMVERRHEGDYYDDDEEDEDDFETYLRKVPFREKMRRIKEIIADISENEEDEEEEEEESTHTFSSISDAVKDIQKKVRKACRNGWINSDGLHDEIFTEFIPELNKLKVVHYVVKDGEVISSDSKLCDEDDDIDLFVSGWKEHKEDKDVDDSED